MLVPAWLAVIVQVPALKIVMLLPVTVQTSSVSLVKATVRPALLVALIVNGAAPYVFVVGVVTVIDCVALATVIATGSLVLLR